MMAGPDKNNQRKRKKRMKKFLYQGKQTRREYKHMKNLKSKSPAQSIN